MTELDASPVTREPEIERLNRLYSALSHVSQAIVRMQTRERLFQDVCKVLVEHGRLRLAWVSWYDPQSRELVPVAQFGDGADVIERVEVASDGRPEQQGPSGIAFREERACVRNELIDDPVTRHGHRAAAAFPIRMQGQVCATLSVSSEHRGFFKDKELTLLTEAAVELSFALDSLVHQEERLQAEAGVEREKRFADNLIETMPGIFYLYDEKGRFLRWNRNFETVSGYSTEEVARMHPLDFFPAEDKPLLEQRIAEVFTNGESSAEAFFLAKDGKVTPYFFTGKRILFEQTSCLLGMGIDITERKLAEDALRKSEHRYRTTLDSTLEGCQLLAFDWRYLYLNDAAALHNRRPNAKLLGQRMPDAWPGIEGTDVFAMLRRCMEERVASHRETEFVFPDGAKGWFDVRAQPVPEGIFVLSIDISERKRAELALQELNESLELKVAERTGELRKARERAESADRIKSAFLATMSHELRTPLNSIIGFTGIILQNLAGPLNPEQDKQLRMVQGSARHLLELINDVLDISKIEAGQLEVRAAPFDLGLSIERAVATVKPSADKKGLALQVRVAATLSDVESDRRRVEQILLNLLNNAIKFTDHGSVTLSAEVASEPSPTGSDGARPIVRIQVVDTGIGMKPDDLSTLFQPFRQIDTGLTRQHEGTGLGLAICRRLTELLGGTICAESSWGRGSVFTVTLPLSRGM